MKHASRIPAQSLKARIRRLGFNPDQLTAGEQEELVAIDDILSAQHELTGGYPARDEADPVLVSP